MKMRLPGILFVLILTAFPLFAQQAGIDYMDNTIIIKFKNADAAEAYKSKAKAEASFLTTYNATPLKQLWKDEYSQQLTSTLRAKGKIASMPDLGHLSNIYEFQYSNEIDPIVLSRKISSLPDVEYAEPRFIYYTDDVAVTTNDPIQNSFVSFHSFDDAWEVSQSSTDVIISIVDSGVNYIHEDLEDKQWLNEDEIPGNGIDDDNNGFIDDYLGWDFWDSGSTANAVQDADPFAINNPHGTHVAGIATASPDNSLGLVGAGFNAKFMAVKAGGIADDPSTGNDESRAVGFGYEGIMYSVINGADIVNCSWGGFGFSAFGEDIVNMATEAGVLVIASAGNSSTNQLHYPSSLENVLSVGALGTNGNIIASYSNYGSTVDVFAQGTIRSSVGVGTSSYATFQGTSMSSPAVSGLAALIKTEYPTWTPEQIRQQIRTSSSSIDQFNSGEFALQLGTGSIDAFVAVSSPQPGIVIERSESFNGSGEKLGINEAGTFKVYLRNVGNNTSSLSINVEALTPGISFSENSFAVGAISNDGVAEVEIPITLTEDILETLSADMMIEFSDNTVGYRDFRVIVFDNLQFDVSDVNNLALSFSPSGNIGFFDAQNGIGGVGFVPDHQTANFLTDNLLFEGGLIFEANERVANNVRSTSGNVDKQFTPIEFYEVIDPGTVSQADGFTMFSPISTTGLDQVEISLYTYAFDTEGLENSVILNYIIRNTSTTLALSEVYLGIFNDWDIGDFSNNNISYNSENDILFAQGETGSEYPMAAVATFANTSSVLAINNNFGGSSSDSQFGLSDGYNIVEKRNSLRAGTDNTVAIRTDVSTVVATGPYFIRPQESVSLGFVYAFGDDETELVNQIIAARNQNLFEVSDLNSNSDNQFPNSIEFFQNYPNPFNPSTTFSFNLSERQSVSLDVYNVLGQKVKSVVNGTLEGGIYSYEVSFDELSSGVYFAILETAGTRELIKLSLIK